MVHAGDAKTLLFLVASFSTVFCTAVNCYTYRIAYPLWRFVGRSEFPMLHAEYLRRLMPVITLPHVVMFFSSGALIWWRPALISRFEAVSLFVLNAAVVVISALAAGPIHTQFARERQVDDEDFHQLMRISAMRVGLMIAASGLIGYVLSVLLRA